MYRKIIFRNAIKSIKDYLIYMVTVTICVTLFYAFLSITSEYYHPPLSAEYSLAELVPMMKAMICLISLLLLFLISYVNRYILDHKQREYAIQIVMGMEQKTLGWIFLAETLIMGGLCIGLGIVLGVMSSQYITALLLDSYDQSYQIIWTLFPDTAGMTIGFFVASFIVIGIWNVYKLCTVDVVEMLQANQKNEKSIKKSKWIPGWTLLYIGMQCLRISSGILTYSEYYNRRYPIPVKGMFVGNIAVPILLIVSFLIWLILRKKVTFSRYLYVVLGFVIINSFLSVLVPELKIKYMLAYDIEVMSQYFIYFIVDLGYAIYILIFFLSHLIELWKEKIPSYRYKGENLFFFGQIISKLQTTSITMTLITITLVAAVFCFMITPALIGWSEGYLKVRSIYDVQVSTQYNQVESEKDIKIDDYKLVYEYLERHQIKVTQECLAECYLPTNEAFYNRFKYDFPVICIKVSDYNAIREMLGYEKIVLQDNQFTTQWRVTIAPEQIQKFKLDHTILKTDGGQLQLAEKYAYTDNIGGGIYNIYTDVVYIVPDKVCDKLLCVGRNLMLHTQNTIPYDVSVGLEEAFMEKYPELEEGMHFMIRTSTSQVNSTKISSFVIESCMYYAGLVLLIICFTILSLQQLLDASKYKYRFGVLQKLGVEEQNINRLIRKQLTIWYGIPIGIGTLLSSILVAYFYQMISVEINAYIGFSTLLHQVATIALILIVLLGCYFASTLFMFQRMIRE